MKKASAFTISTLIVGITVNLISNQIQGKIDESDLSKDNVERVIIENKIEDTREVSLVNFSFSIQKHEWYIRLGGIILLTYGFFVPVPFGSKIKEEIEKEALTLGYGLRYAPEYMKRKGAESLSKKWTPIVRALGITTLIIYYSAIWYAGSHLNWSIPKYSLLSAERIFNFILGLI